MDYLEAVLEEGTRSLGTPEKHSSRTVRDHRGRYPLLDDEDLMLLVEGGDADAFAALYDRHYRLAYSVAHKLTGEKHSAEDLTQDAFLKVWRSAD